MRPNRERSVRLACRMCNTDQMDFLPNLVQPCREGWENIVPALESEHPTPYRWWTHIGTCPRCLKLEAEITSERSYRFCGLTIRFRTAS